MPQSLRVLFRDRWFALSVLLLLASGLTASLSLYSVLEACFLRQLPVRDPGRLVSIQLTNKLTRDRRSISTLFEHLDRACKSFEAVTTVYTRVGLAKSGSLPSHQVNVEAVRANYIQMLGLAPHAGTLLLQPGTVLLSHRYWTRRLQADPAVIGATLALDRKVYTIAGVFDPRFTGLDAGNGPDLTILDTDPAAKPAWGVARLAPGATIASATPELEVEFRNWERVWMRGSKSGTKSDIQILLVLAANGIADTLRFEDGQIPILFGVSLFVFAIALMDCVFLAAARMERKAAEFAIRRSLGASSAGIARILLTENAMLVIPACAIALLLTRAIHPLLLSLLSGQKIAEVLRFAWTPELAALTLACAVFCIAVLTVPFLGASVRPGARLMDVSMAVQIAVTVVACLAGLSAWQSYTNLERVDLGYGTRNMWVASIDLEQSTSAIPAQRAYRELQDTVRALPGVESATLSMTGLFQTPPVFTRMFFDGGPAEGVRVHLLLVGSQFFTTAKARLLSGRDFTDQDNELRRPVYIVNDAFARLSKGAARVRWMPNPNAEPGDIIGVVADARHEDLKSATGPIVYVPLLQRKYRERVEAVIRTRGNTYPGALREAVARLDPSVPVYDEHSIEQDRYELLRPERGLAFGSTSAMAAGLALSCAGLYSVFLYRQRLRNKEFAIRAALGASRVALAWTASRRIGASIAAGLLAGGFAGGAIFVRLQPSLFDVTVDAGAWYALLSAAVVAMLAASVVFLPALRLYTQDLLTEIKRL